MFKAFDAQNLDNRSLVGERFVMNNNDVSITRRERIRVRTAFYTGTTDGDATTTITLSGLPINAVILGVLAMIYNGTMWRMYGTNEAASANDAFTTLHYENAASRTVEFASVGANLQSQPYRITVFWTERV